MVKPAHFKIQNNTVTFVGPVLRIKISKVTTIINIFLIISITKQKNSGKKFKNLKPSLQLVVIHIKMGKLEQKVPSSEKIALEEISHLANFIVKYQGHRIV